MDNIVGVDLKNIHNLKVESYVLFCGSFLGLQAWEAASQVTVRELLQGGQAGVARLYRSLTTKGR